MGVFRASKGVVAGAGEGIHVVECPYDFLVRKPASQSSNPAKTVQIMEVNNVCTLECRIEVPAQRISNYRNRCIKTLLADDEVVNTRGHCVHWGREGFGPECGFDRPHVAGVMSSSSLSF